MTQLELDAADAYCRALTRGHYENFAVSSGFVDAAIRRDLARIYAFCRITDDLGDESAPGQALPRLALWRDDLSALFDGRMPMHPVLAALGETVQNRRIAAQPFFDLIDANVQDQHVTQYADWPALVAYCRLSAAPVGRMVLRVFGIDDPAAEGLSDDVCIGLQLANHAQDVSRDVKIGRTYLVQSDLEAGGVRHAVHTMVERARALLASGRQLEAIAPMPLRLQLSLYRLGGLAICDAIARAGYATDRMRPSVSTAMKVQLAVRALGEAWAPRRNEVRHAENA